MKKDKYTPDTEINWVEHEVKLRLHDWKFKLLEHKLNFLIGLMASNMIIPSVLKHFGI